MAGEGKGWQKSSRCETSDCVEVRVDDQEVRVRDSKRPDSPVLTFTHQEWDAFTAGVRAGEFD